MQELYKGLPLFNLDVLDDMTGIEIVSLVTYPAIQRDFVKFAKEQEIKFSVVDEEKRVVSGPALIPDHKIYRRDDFGNEFYVQMSAEAIERMAIKFFGDHNSTNVNLEHEYDVDGCVYFESYLIDKERGICPSEFSDLPNGTWMLSCKINNDCVWGLIKNGTLRGFSIEGNCNITPTEKVIDSVEELLETIIKK